MTEHFAHNRIGWLTNAGLVHCLRRWLPQGLRDVLNRWGGFAIYYRGEYADWATAHAAASGYDAMTLIHKLAEAARAVRDGEAEWEQDGVTWDHVPANMPLFASLGRVALAQDKRLTVLDFGGGFGCSYLQCRNFFGDKDIWLWGVVEQPALVAIGQRDFERDALRFYASIDEAVASHQPDVAILSSVLQYLEKPWVVLDRLMAVEIPYLIIDRHPCSFTRELITVQVLPASLYCASYPSWLFDCPSMLERLQQHYELLAAWEGKDPPIRGWRKGAEFRGFLLRYRQAL